MYLHMQLPLTVLRFLRPDFCVQISIYFLCSFFLPLEGLPLIVLIVLLFWCRILLAFVLCLKSIHLCFENSYAEYRILGWEFCLLVLQRCQSPVFLLTLFLLRNLLLSLFLFVSVFNVSFLSGCFKNFFLYHFFFFRNLIMTCLCVFMFLVFEFF